MRNKAVEKTTTGPRDTSKQFVTRKSKDMAKLSGVPQTRRKTANPVASLKSQGDMKSRKKPTSAKSSISATKNDQLSVEGSKTPAKVKSSILVGKNSKASEGSKKVKGAKKKIEKVGKMPKASPVKTKCKSKKQLELKSKGKSKKKDSSPKDINQFIDFWSLASIGKREASLNATMKVNIMYERQVSPKKSSSTDSSPVKATPSTIKESIDPKVSAKECKTASNKTNTSSPIQKSKTCNDKESAKKAKSTVSPKKTVGKKSESSSKKDSEKKNRKRKSKYKIYEDEPAAKARKKDTNDKRSSKNNSKKVAKKGKKSVLGHSLGNIIERSPRQASLNAKAMIAMEQEDDAPVETAARTKIYDWTEVRSLAVGNETRKMVWVTGSGDVKRLPHSNSKKSGKHTASNKTSLSISDVVDSRDIEQSDSNLLHSTLLKTIHEVGDARLLKEFIRSQKEDFPGEVDIERCPTPEPPPPPPDPVKAPSTPSPKKKSSPSKSCEVKKTPEKQMKKPIVPSPTKPKLCRVATPIPQFSPGQQRPSHITSYVHHPVSHTQPVYPNLRDQQHQKQPPQQPTQPIKVTPYAPGSAYVYQCSPTDRQQQNIFVPNTPSPMPPFSNDANDLVQRNFPAAFTFNQMGSLSFERRGLNPYHHPQTNAYNPTMHLPIQPIGFNFQQFYQPSIQQLHNQQNIPQSIQQVPLPAHQQFALVPPPHPLPPPSVMQQSQPLPPAHINPIRPFQQSNYPQYQNPVPSATTEMKQDKSCMPPPPACPVAQSLPQQQSLRTSIVQPLPSYRRAIPVSPQVQSPHKLIKPSPERLSCITIANSTCNVTTTISPSIVSHTFPSPPNQIFKPVGSGNVIIHNPLPIRPVAAVNASFRPIVCKKETKAIQSNCDKSSNPETPVESPKKPVVMKKSDESSMSDILHSAHSTMFSVEEKSSSDSPNYTKQRNQTVDPTTSSISVKNSCSTNTVVSSRGTENFNGSYSVTSILEMPTCKIKSEPKTKDCNTNTEKSCPLDQRSKAAKKETYFLCIPPPKVSGKAGPSLLTTKAIHITDNFPFKNSEDFNIKQFPHSSKVIVIDDSEDSSDDEPLAKLVQSKPNEVPNIKQISFNNKTKKTETEAPKVKKVKSNAKTLKVKLFEKKSDPKATQLKDVKTKANSKQCKDNKSSKKIVSPLKKSLKVSSSLSPKLKNKQLKGKSTTASQLKPKKMKNNNQKLKKMEDFSSEKGAPKNDNDNVCEENSKINLAGCDVGADGNSSATAPSAKKQGPKVMKKATGRKKSKAQALVPPVLPKTKAIHGWSWIGEGELKMIPKLTQLREESLRLRKCYKSMKHTFGEVISVKDCVILQSDGDGSVPYVGKVSALWENLNGDMMFSMLWYYQPEHTAAGREPEDGESELFASKHREENSVACIDDKCYVLMYNEFCRMEADAMRLELGVPTPSSHQVIPPLSEEDRKFLRPLPPSDVGMDNIWFCRYDYDTRKKIVRKPKHKKTDLRYRGPCKLVQ